MKGEEGGRVETMEGGEKSGEKARFSMGWGLERRTERWVSLNVGEESECVQKRC